jgi:hypothetical protein
VKGEPILMRVGMTMTADGCRALIPADQRAIAETVRWEFGETVAVKITRGRSLPMHRLFWGILDHVAKASAFENGERLLVALKIRLGRYDLMMMPNGKVVPVPQSISFGSMPQDDFQRFMDESIQLICTEVLPGTNSADLIQEVELMLGPTHSAHPAPDRGGGEGESAMGPHRAHTARSSK